jgi:hypothetical protein
MAPVFRLPRFIGRGGFGLSTLYRLLGGMADFQVGVAYQLARLVPGTVHAYEDAPLPAGVAPADTSPADGGLTSALRLANALRALFMGHLAGVGTATSPGAHLAADAAQLASLSAVRAATDLATCAALANALQGAVNAHLRGAGVHFHDDATPQDATPPAGDLPSTIALLDNLAVFIEAHIARVGVTPGFTR